MCFKVIALSRWKALQLENNKVKIVRNWIGLWYQKTNKALTSRTNVGKLHCENCNNDTTFEIWELANTASFGLFYLLWIPIIEADKKLYLICSNCKVGYEISEEDKTNLRENTISLSEMIKLVKGRKPPIKKVASPPGLYDL